MMKRLASLLLAFLLLAAPALAENPLLNQLARVRAQRLLTTICETLDKEQLAYEKDDEYDGCFLSIDLSTPSALGDAAYFSIYAYEDGVNIICSYSAEVPATNRNELMRLCHHFTSGVYLGKFYVDPYYDELCYEIFIPMDALDVRDYDRTLISDYLWTALGTLEYYQEYFLMVMAGESADNVFAMWEADED